jgi:hypothetical protein
VPEWHTECWLVFAEASKALADDEIPVVKASVQRAQINATGG